MEDKRFPKARKVMKTDSGTCTHQSFVMGYGVPSVPYIVNLATVATNNWNASWAIPLGCRAVKICRETKTNAFKISTEAAGTNYISIMGTDVFEMHEMFGPEDTVTLYFQNTTDTSDIQIMYWLDGQDCG